MKTTDEKNEISHPRIQNTSQPIILVLIEHLQKSDTSLFSY
jgi:hypothetical protein